MVQENEWRIGAECNSRYRVTDGKGTVYGRQYTVTMRLNGEQMDALREALKLSIRIDGPTREVYVLLEGAFLSGEHKIIPKGEG